MDVRCRVIETGDLESVIALLACGYRDQRGLGFWRRAVGLLASRGPVGDFSRFGYLLESDGQVVGVVLLIFAYVPSPEGMALRCNLSSWYVAEAFRPYGPMLVSRALRHREATYINITPAPHTFPILAAQGFIRYCDGRLIVLPLLSRWRGGARVTSFAPGMRPGEDLSELEVELLRSHAEHGCMSLVCTDDGGRHPFVFARRRRGGVVALALLAYCRDLAEFVRFAVPIGWFLARRGYGLIVLDASGPIDGLTGFYASTRPKYYRGGNKPRLGDTAYTERTMFGS